MRTCFVTIDIENDLNKDTFENIKHVKDILKIFDKHQISATMFVTGEVIEKFPEQVKSWSKKHEIGCHGYSHINLKKFSKKEREDELIKFEKTYVKCLNTKPTGFRAVQHTIDNFQFDLLEKYNYKYDSSVMPSYPFFMNYKGFNGKAPETPYFPSKKDYRKKGKNNRKILEIPCGNLLFGVPLSATWIRNIPLIKFKFLMLLKKPKNLNLAMHGWDAYPFVGKYSKNSGGKYLKILDNILRFVKKYYKFKNCDEILKNVKRNK